MRNRSALTKELADLLTKYGVDTYCSDHSALLAAKLVSDLEELARIQYHQR